MPPGCRSVRSPRHTGSITTVRTYVNGLRVPGEPAARADDFAPFAAYCRRRLADDPHLRTPALLAEFSCLGLGNSRATRYRAMERHGIQTHPCPGCHPASMSGYSPLAATRAPQPAPLPVPAAPVAGETLASFLSRLAALNRTTREALLDILPPWFRVKTRWHDDRWQPPSLISRADDAAARLAVISGSGPAASPSGPPQHAASARRRAASASRSWSACPPTTRSASGTAPGLKGAELHQMQHSVLGVRTAPHGMPIRIQRGAQRDQRAKQQVRRGVTGRCWAGCRDVASSLVAPEPRMMQQNQRKSAATRADAAVGRSSR